MLSLMLFLIDGANFYLRLARMYRIGKSISSSEAERKAGIESSSGLQSKTFDYDHVNDAFIDNYFIH